MVPDKLVTVFSKAYRHRQFDEPLLELGRTKFARQDLYDRLGNGHTVAAAGVSRTLKTLGVTSAAQILRVPLVDWARINGFGEARLRVLLDLLIYNSVKQDDIRRWITSDLRGTKLVQWESICRQVAKLKTGRRGHEV